MALSRVRRAGLGAILLLLAGQAAAQKPPDLTAVLTRIEGQMTLSSEGRADLRTVRRAASRQVIRRGETVHVPGGSQATLICSTDTLVDLKGPVEWILDTTACERGLRIPETSYRNSVPHAGRLLPRKGVLLLEFGPRNWKEVPPVLLSPRNTAVRDPRPPLIWTWVPDAVGYEIEIRGEIRITIPVAARDLQCGRGAGPWRDLDVCTWTPSGRWPVLEPGTPVLLHIRDVRTLTPPYDFYKLHLLPANDQETLQDSLRQIATLPVDTASRLLLTAGAYARAGLSTDAIMAYDEALREQDVPAARVTLGDLYLDSGLIGLADREYRQVLAGAPDPAVQAAAELGLGYVAYFWKRFPEARERFERARDAYAALGLPVEAEDARAAAASCSP